MKIQQGWDRGIEQSGGAGSIHINRAETVSELVAIEFSRAGLRFDCFLQEILQSLDLGAFLWLSEFGIREGDFHDERLLRGQVRSTRMLRFSLIRF